MRQQSDVIIVGGGLAGMVTALELLNEGQKVLIIDRDTHENFGGLARWAFGGMFFVNSPLQRRRGIRDSIQLAMQDWFNFAEFDTGEYWGKKWAEQYIHLCTDHSYGWLRKLGISFFPVVNWAERGLYRPGNSVPRFHLVWGTGWALVEVLKGHLLAHPKAKNLSFLFEHRVQEILLSGQQISGVKGIKKDGKPFEASASVVVVASGGINGSIDRIKAHWPGQWGTPPQTILNGAHKYAVGDLHDATEKINGNVVNLDKQWNYAAGIRHYQPRQPDHGLSLVPCKSALWLNYEGRRFGPMPLVTPYDTRFLVERICQEPLQYSWQLLNRRIAFKEFAISGSEHNEAVRDKKFLKFVFNTAITGNRSLVKKVIDHCEDVLTGRSVEELVGKMNDLTGTPYVKLKYVKEAVDHYDGMIDRGPAYHNDEQLRRIAHARLYRGDRIRTCKFQKIDDPKARPLMAIRVFIVSRKSLGGIQTDLNGRVLTGPSANDQQAPIPGLYAVGEAAGFGGGGMHGHRSLEGTFLGGCVISGRIAGKSIVGKCLQ